MPKMPRKERPDVIAISRYSREDYPACRAIPPADNGMEETYDAWLEMQQAAVAGARMQRYEPLFIEVRSDELAAWLKAKDLPNSPENRAWYGHEMASAKLSTKQ